MDYPVATPRPPSDPKNHKFRSTGDFGGPNAPKQCTAMSRRTGQRCKGPAIADSPNQKCRMHGGFSRYVGGANLSLTHGRHSRYIPADLDKLYLDAINNPELLEMSDHIALLEAHMQQVLATATAGNPVPKWSDMVEIFADIETGLLSGDQKLAIESIARMHTILDAGAMWDKTWGQVTEVMEQLRRMADTEIKRKRELNQMVPVERVMVLMAAMGMAVKRHVTNPDEIRAVYAELQAMQSGTRTLDGAHERVPSTYINISPESRGVKGGGSEKARQRRRSKETKRRKTVVEAYIPKDSKG